MFKRDAIYILSSFMFLLLSLEYLSWSNKFFQKKIIENYVPLKCPLSCKKSNTDITQNEYIAQKHLYTYLYIKQTFPFLLYEAHPPLRRCDEIKILQNVTKFILGICQIKFRCKNLFLNKLTETVRSTYVNICSLCPQDRVLVVSISFIYRVPGEIKAAGSLIVVPICRSTYVPDTYVHRMGAETWRIFLVDEYNRNGLDLVHTYQNFMNYLFTAILL